MSLAYLHAGDCSEPHDDAVWGVAWTALDTVVSISADGTVKQWSPNGQPYPPNGTMPPAHSLGLVSLSTSSDGKYALYNSLEGLTYLCDLSTGNVLGRHESYLQSDADAEPSWAVSLHPNGETYASTGASGNVFVLSASPENFGSQLAVIPSGRHKFGMDCKHSPDGKRIATSSETGQIYIFDLESQALANTYTSHAMTVRSIAWSLDNQLLLSASEDKRLVLHDMRTSSGGSVATLTGHSSWVLSADISPDGRLGLSGSADKTIKVWDLAARTAVSTIQDTGEVWAVAFRPKPPAPGSGGAGAFVSGGEDGVVKWWRGAGAAS